MLSEFIDKIVSLANEPIIDVNERPYSLEKIYQIKEPLVETLNIKTLTGLVDYLNSNYDDLKITELLIHIENYNRISVLSNCTDPWLERNRYIQIVFEGYNFDYECKYTTETFIIKLQSLFEPTEDLLKILQLVGNIKAEQATTSTDDGVTQTVAAKAGVVLSEKAIVPNPVTLKPFRTFREIEQPESKFIFRVHSKSDAPYCALYEADGGLWKLNAIQSIKKYLKEKIKDAIIIA